MIKLFFSIPTICFFIFFCTSSPAEKQDFFAKEDKLKPPVFETFKTEKNGVVEIQGLAPGFSFIELINGSHILGHADVSETGEFLIRSDIPSQRKQSRLVLRATNRQGFSATSLQTLIISASEEQSRIFALIEEPGKSTRLISFSEFSSDILSLPSSSDRNFFSIDEIIFQDGGLKICGKAPAGLRVSITSSNLAIGFEQAENNNVFCIIRMHALQAGDYIFHTELSDDSGGKIDSINIAFSIKNVNLSSRQVYRNGQPVSTILVRRGETLSHIAKRIYGDSSFADVLFKANRDILQSPNKIDIGQELVLPFSEMIKKSRDLHASS